MGFSRVELVEPLQVVIRRCSRGHGESLYVEEMGAGTVTKICGCSCPSNTGTRYTIDMEIAEALMAQGKRAKKRIENARRASARASGSFPFSPGASHD